MKREEDRQFNRFRDERSDRYITDRGGLRADVEHEGYIKCKLVHGKGFSLIVPDQVFLHGPQLRWFQPLSFCAHNIADLGSEKVCTLGVDVSCRQTLRVRFSSRTFIRRFADRSELFRCTIAGCGDLAEYTTGRAILTPEKEIRILLHHFTTDAAKSMIEESGCFRASSWNIQGNKKLVNVGYAYFTCLDAIACDADLQQIAMASDGIVYLVSDRLDLPDVFDEKWAREHPDDVVMLSVYRESTTNRRARISVWIPASFLSPQPIHKHFPQSGAVYYDICKPFIHRVGLAQAETLCFEGGWALADQNVKHFRHIVYGSADSLSGLGAPYDEENTTERVITEDTSPSHSMLDFWFEHANTDLVSGRSFEMPRFAP